VRKTEKRFRENPLPTGPLVEQYTVAWPCVWCGGKGLVTVSSENVFEPAALEDFEF